MTEAPEGPLEVKVHISRVKHIMKGEEEPFSVEYKVAIEKVFDEPRQVLEMPWGLFEAEGNMEVVDQMAKELVVNWMKSRGLNVVRTDTIILGDALKNLN